jgi:hypothetical protein
VTVNLQVSPDDVGLLGVAGFKVYGPEPDKQYLQSGADPHRRPNQVGTFTVERDGLYIVQVHNWRTGPD